MFKEEYQTAANVAAKKSGMLKKNPIGYFVLSMMAGMFIGFGVILTNVLGTQFQGAYTTKLVMGLTFGVGLNLVVLAGAELFTGNNLMMAAGALKKTVTWGDAGKLWCVCWLGNFAGSLVTAILYVLTGLGNGDVGVFMGNASVSKMTAGPVQLVARAILCNILVCLATWCGTKLKNEAAKIIMIAWCLLAFITTGFEHSVANMTLFCISLMIPSGTAVTVGGAVYNLILVTIGNMIGGICFVAVPYFLSQKED